MREGGREGGRKAGREGGVGTYLAFVFTVYAVE